MIYSTDLTPENTPSDEDSSTTEFDSSTLFKLKRVPGIDRQETGLRVNTGLQYFNET